MATEVYRNSIFMPDSAPIVADLEPREAITRLAEKIDRNNAILAEQLENFESAGAASVGGVPASSIAAGANSMYYQTFEDDVTDSWDLASGSIAGVTFPNNGIAGGRCLRTTNKAVWIISDINIPFDPSRLYRIRTRVRDISGTHRTAYVGVMGVGADGTTVVDRTGSTGQTTTQNLVCLAGTISNTAWTVYTGYFKGTAASGDASTPSTAPDSPRVLHEDTRYFRPMLALSQGGDDQTIEIDYIVIEVLTEQPEIDELLEKVGGASGTDADKVAGAINQSDGRIANDKVQSGSIRTGAVGGGGDGGKNHIIAGSIVAANIKALTIQAAQIGSLTGAGLTLNFHATGTDPVINHSNFKILADGSAEFAGDLKSSTASTSSLTINSSAAVGLQTQLGAAYMYMSTDANENGFIGWAQGAGPGYESLTIVRANSASYTSRVLIDADSVTLGGDTKVTGDIGFFNGTPASKTSVADLGSLNTVSGTGDDGNINSNFASILSKINDLLDALQSYNLV